MALTFAVPQDNGDPFVVGPEMQSVIQETFGDDEGGRDVAVRFESATLKERTISIVFSGSGGAPLWLELRHPSVKRKGDTISGVFAWRAEPDGLSAEIRQWLMRRLEVASNRFVWKKLDGTKEGSEPEVLLNSGTLSARDRDTLQTLRSIFGEAALAKVGSSEWQVRLGEALSFGDLHPEVLFFAAVRLRALEIPRGEEAFLFLYKRALAQVAPYLKINSDGIMRSKLQRIRIASLLALGKTQEGLKWLDRLVAKGSGNDGQNDCSVQALLAQGVGRGDGRLWRSWTHTFLEGHPQCRRIVLARVLDQRARDDIENTDEVTHPLRDLERALVHYYEERFDESVRVLTPISNDPVARIYLALAHYRSGRPLEAERWLEKVAVDTMDSMALYSAGLILRNSRPEHALALVDKALKASHSVDAHPRITVNAIRLKEGLGVELERSARGETMRAIGDPEADRFGEALGAASLAPSSVPLVASKPPKPREPSAAVQKSHTIPEHGVVKDQQRPVLESGAPQELQGSLRWAWWILGGVVLSWALIRWWYARRGLQSKIDRQAEDRAK